MTNNLSIITVTLTGITVILTGIILVITLYGLDLDISETNIEQISPEIKTNTVEIILNNTIVKHDQHRVVIPIDIRTKHFLNIKTTVLDTFNFDPSFFGECYFKEIKITIMFNGERRIHSDMQKGSLDMFVNLNYSPYEIFIEKPDDEKFVNTDVGHIYYELNFEDAQTKILYPMHGTIDLTVNLAEEKRNMLMTCFEESIKKNTST